MIDLDEIKIPCEDDIHKMIEIVKISPLPSRNGNVSGKTTFDNYSWYDTFRINYTLKNNILRVTPAKNLDSLLEHFNKIKSDIKVCISVNNAKEFNELCRALRSNPTNKNMIIAFDGAHFNMRQWLCFEMLPDNVKVCPSFDYSCYEEDEFVNGGSSFDWWGLWLNDEDFECVRKKLTPKAKERFEKMRFIAKSFYENFTARYGTFASDKQKTDFVFQWISKNITYDYSATNPDGTLAANGTIAQDIIQSFQRKTGVCVGRSGLMKVLLNNRFMRVNCFLTEGMCGNLQHTWNHVYFEDGTDGYYDLSFGVRNSPTLNTRYRNIDDSDYEIGFVPNICSTPVRSVLRPLPSRRVSSTSEVPPSLPPRRELDDTRTIQKRKTIRRGMPPALPPRHQ